MNYYEILELEFGADEKEIKSAYKRLLRKYPPEKEPEKFKLIREAYEVLSNSKSKAQYDAMSKYGDEINNYLDVGNEAFENEEYEKAANAFKKILIIDSSFAIARNRLGLAYLNMEKFSEALSQFNKLVQEYPDNATYLYNLAWTNKELKNLDMAIKYFKMAYEIDKINTDIIITLADTYYYDKKQYNEATKLLREAISFTGKTDFEDFIYFFKLIEFSIMDDKFSEAEKLFNEVEKIIPENQEAKDYVIWKFGKFAYELYEYKAYDLSAKVSKLTMNIDPSNIHIKELYEAANNHLKTDEQWHKLKNDYQVTNGLKRLIALWLTDNISDEERDNYFENIMSEIIHEPVSDILKAINILKNQYPDLYKLNSEFLGEIKAEASKVNNNNNYSDVNNNTSTYNSNPNYSNTNYSNSTTSRSNSCFVATAAFGTPWAQEINILRKWRDTVLAHNILGRAFVSFYYKVGPYLAKVVEKSKFLKSLTRKVIYKIIKEIEKRNLV